MSLALVTRGYVCGCRREGAVTVFGEGPEMIGQVELKPDIDRAGTGEPDQIPGITGSEELVPTISGATESQISATDAPTGTGDELVPIITDAKEED